MFNRSVLFITLLISDSVLIFLAVYLGASGKNPLKNFEEGGFITWVSTGKFIVMAALSTIIYHFSSQARQEHCRRFYSAIWLLMAAGFLFLAGDELFQWHEKADELIHQVLNMKETRLSDRIDDLIVGVYLVLGLTVLYGGRREVLQYLTMFPFIITAFAISIIMVFLDMYTNLAPGDWISPAIYRLSITEDALKIYAESFFLMAFINAVWDAGNSRKTQQTLEKSGGN